jgi:hypothetical protein
MIFRKKGSLNVAGAVGFLLIAFLISASLGFGHGGKHDPEEFTQLMALKKATGLYDQLIGSGKLHQSWENALSRVEVIRREKEGQNEIVVVFHRAEGDPQTVYIFFTAGGEYAGSNFTGE